MNGLLFHLTTIAIFFGVGLWCLTQAIGMQKRAVAASEKLNLKLFRKYIKSKSYVIVTRIAGAAFIIVAILLALTLARV